MIRRAVPVRYDRIASTGRNKPLLITVETSDGQEHEVYLKASARPELGVEGLANEALAACLAGDLGLPINEPFLVPLDPQWVNAIPDPATRLMLQQSAPIGFASKSHGPQWKVWSPGDALTAGRQPTALEILAFDAYIGNDDRIPSNPNCYVKGDAFRIIDHELAFRIKLKLFPRLEPWKSGNLAALVLPQGHIFGARLKGKALDYSAIRQAWATLSDRRFLDYQSALPPEWAAAQSAINDALTHLRTVRDRIDDCLAELERALT